MDICSHISVANHKNRVFFFSNKGTIEKKTLTLCFRYSLDILTIYFFLADPHLSRKNTPVQNISHSTKVSSVLLEPRREKTGLWCF